MAVLTVLTPSALYNRWQAAGRPVSVGVRDKEVSCTLLCVGMKLLLVCLLSPLPATPQLAKRNLVKNANMLF